MADRTPYPAIGRTYEARFGDLAYRLKFDADGETMTFTSIGDDAPVAEAVVTVRYTAMFIRPGVFMVYWTEPDGSTVVHVEDFENDAVHTNITLPDRTFLNLAGTFRQLPE